MVTYCKQKNQSGFSALEVCLVIFAILVLGLASSYIYSARHDKTTRATNIGQNKTSFLQQNVSINNEASALFPEGLVASVDDDSDTTKTESRTLTKNDGKDSYSVRVRHYTGDQSAKSDKELLDKEVTIYLASPLRKQVVIKKEVTDTTAIIEQTYDDYVLGQSTQKVNKYASTKIVVKNKVIYYIETIGDVKQPQATSDFIGSLKITE